MTLGRKDLAARIAEETGLTAAQADDALVAWERIVTAAVAEGTPVRLPGLLSIDVVDRAARNGRNPATGEPLEIPATRAVRITAGSRLKVAARS
ncbi:HU family DNA-binding protein [Demequina maris]|uniref:HU family DNA-binding protein n=1 Tax=Demequina maris TaxID=1638982 RepID=UPI000785255C|nr:HU family DNA-binding protein [Demequina maris]